MSAMREDNKRLSQSVADMRAERRMQDRKIRDLELELAMAKEKAPRNEAIPQLPVEVVAPPSSPESGRVVAIAEDGTEIVYEGDAALGKSAVIELEPPRRMPAPRSEPASDRSEPTRRPSPVSARASHAPVRSDPTGDAAGAEYRAAVELVKSGTKDEAVAALRKFLENHARHEYADNAQYWLGEAYYGVKDYKNALMEFRATIETYPRGNKVPDALLKVGYCYSALGQVEKARAVLEQVVNLYPKTEPAALAAKRLETP
jgi:tol-pal system protein YbgF